MMNDNIMRGNLLGVDFGTKRIGLAVGQNITQTATPLRSLSVQKGIPWDQLTQLVKEWEIQGFVVGLALQEDNRHSPTSKAAQRFGQQLKAYFKLPVFFVNERLTSVMAQERLKESYSSKGDLDAIAAAIILESWFNEDSKEIVNYDPGQHSI